MVLTLSREDRSNALSRQMLSELGQKTREAIADPAVRAIIVTGKGTRAFCAGADLKERTTMDDDAVREQLAAYRAEFGVLDRSPKPVIAAINGVALGGGLELALACDLRVATSHVILALPETSLGIIPGAGGTQRLPRLLGEARAKELILLGRRLTAEEALAWGLVNCVASAERPLLEQVLAYIEPILGGAPIAQAAALAAIDASFDLPLAAGLERELSAYETCLQSEDRRLALAAFAHKRRPVFEGR